MEKLTYYNKFSSKLKYIQTYRAINYQAMLKGHIMDLSFFINK